MSAVPGRAVIHDERIVAGASAAGLAVLPGFTVLPGFAVCAAVMVPAGGAGPHYPDL